MIGSDPLVNEYVQWLKTNGYNNDLRNKYNPSPYILAIFIPCLLWKYTAILGIVMIVRYVVNRKKASIKINNEWKRLYGMKSILCESIMVNAEFIEGKGDYAPGLYIGSFDSEWGKQEITRKQVLQNIEDAKEGKFGEEVRRAIQAVIDNEAYVKNRRRIVPAILSNGLRVYFFDVALVKEWLSPETWPAGVLQIVCIAEYGNKGDIRLIPSEVLDSKVERVMKRQLGKDFETVNN